MLIRRAGAIAHTSQFEMEKNENAKSSLPRSRTGSREDMVLSLEQGLTVPAEDLVNILHRCRKERNRACATQLHAYMRKCGLESHPLLGNHLVETLASVGSICGAAQVFELLANRNASTWNALITGYANNGELENAYQLAQKMQEDNSLHPTKFTYAALLSACARLKDVELGKRLHAEIAFNELLQKDLFIGSSLVAMYAKGGLLTKAQEVFDKLSCQDVVLWTAIISAYEEHGYGVTALRCYDQMQREGFSPNVVTYVSSLKACGCIGAIGKGRALHAEVTTKGLENHLLVGTALVDMYAKCRELAEAQEVFDRLTARDVVSWNSLIIGYAEYGPGGKALDLLEQMQQDGVSPTAATFVCSLKACANLRAVREALILHADIARRGLDRTLLIGSTLVDLYAKCGLLAKAQEVFDRLVVQDVVSWNALIAGYAKHGQDEETFSYLECMQSRNISPDNITSMYAMNACGRMGTTERAGTVHAEIVKRGFDRDVIVSSNLIDMYAKCGLRVEAEEMFYKLTSRDIVTWTALITCYTQFGLLKSVFCSFDQMVNEGVKPNPVTFVSVLNGCSHEGLVDGAQAWFESMNKYAVVPNPQHYSCLIDFYGRSGQFDKVLALIKEMPFVPDAVVWHSYLHALQSWRHLGYAQPAFESSLLLDGKDVASFICMSNIFANTDMQDDFD